PRPRGRPGSRREARALVTQPAHRRGHPRRLPQRRRPPERGRRPHRAAGPRPDGGGVRVSTLSAHEVIVRPVISEKSIDLSNQEPNHRYTFEVHRDANKIQIKAAIEELYKKES